MEITTTTNRNISMVRGDTFAFTFEVGGVDHLESAFFSCKINDDDAQYLFQKSLGDGITDAGDGKYRVRVAPDETKNLEVGSYYYDVEIGMNGDIFTPMRGRLKIERDITRH